MIAEYDATGTLLTEYIWLDDRPVGMIADAGSMAPKLYFVHTDHLERPAMMTDDTADVVWRASYLPFGEAASITGSATLDYRFPGQWFQIETGLAYNWHRHYDATTGRYLQPDPLGMPDGPSRWGYVRNSPQMRADKEGLRTSTVPMTPKPVAPADPQLCMRYGDYPCDLAFERCQAAQPYNSTACYDAWKICTARPDIPVIFPGGIIVK